MREPPAKTEQCDEDARAAAEWFVRLRSPAVSPSDQAAFRDWIEADPKRAEAYEDMQRLWQQSRAPAELLGAGGWYRTKPPARSQRGVGLAFAAVLLLAAGLLWREPGLPIRLASDYSTLRGEHAEVTLADGSRAFLDGDSAIAVDFERGRRRVVLLRGRVWLDVATKEGQPFDVIAKGITTRVTGTRFAVEREYAGISVTVEDGRVAVRPRNGADADVVAVSAGERADVGPRIGSKVTAVDSDTSLAWRRGLIVFDRATLASVVHEINRMLPGRVMVTDDSLSKLQMSGVFRSDDPQAILDALRQGLQVRTTKIPGLATLIHR